MIVSDIKPHCSHFLDSFSETRVMRVCQCGQIRGKEGGTGTKRE